MSWDARKYVEKMPFPRTVEVIRDTHGTTESAVYIPERTCHDISEPPTDGGFWPTPHFKCSLCRLSHVSMDYVFYCPNCGAKVIDD